ncbi:hypothetical protein [Metabacillus fastidiosus]|uniref:hypothetical protein n=1 Tax=Metabacillus fastidiosus TaxID=1458 RepID=UPI002DB9B4A2|nr:hypothetical protein [Metabacillus fastidiosus]MEC2078460.1 hypothetical protein [Metabacillus fastidiosus]
MDKITVSSFLVKKPITDLEDLLNRPEDYIITTKNDLDDFVEFVKKNKDNLFEEGILALDGGICISQGYKTITDVGYWDDLPTLWAYLLNLIENYLKEGEAKYYFPSQPIEINLKEGTQGNIIFSIDKNSLNVKKEIFFDVFLEQASIFFDILVNKLDLSSYEYEIKKINEIKQLI